MPNPDGSKTAAEWLDYAVAREAEGTKQKQAEMALNQAIKRDEAEHAKDFAGVPSLPRRAA